jgi:hypothetical protein
VPKYSTGKYSEVLKYTIDKNLVVAKEENPRIITSYISDP